jgi:hypothetical protein
MWRHHIEKIQETRIFSWSDWHSFCQFTKKNAIFINRSENFHIMLCFPIRFLRTSIRLYCADMKVDMFQLIMWDVNHVINMYYCLGIGFLFFSVYLRNTWPSVVRVFRSLIVRHRLIFVFLLHLIDVPFIQFTEFTSLEMFGRSYSTIAKIIRGELWNIVVLLVRFCIVGCCASLYNHSDKMSAN